MRNGVSMMLMAVAIAAMAIGGVAAAKPVSSFDRAVFGVAQLRKPTSNAHAMDARPRVQSGDDNSCTSTLCNQLCPLDNPSCCSLTDDKCYQNGFWITFSCCSDSSGKCCGKLTGGGIAVIVVLVLLFVACIAACVYFCCCRQPVMVPVQNTYMVMPGNQPQTVVMGQPVYGQVPPQQQYMQQPPQQYMPPQQYVQPQVVYQPVPQQQQQQQGGTVGYTQQ